MKKTILRSNEFTCPSCVSKIETGLKRLAGVSDATVHFSTGRIEVQHDPEAVTPGQLASAIRELGYEARPSAY